tara:strand:+ start:1273 stop:2415 length:1143 start_codon:yes stop_codon:yes gene_type:complete
VSCPVVNLGDVVSFIGGSQPPKSTFMYEPQQGYVRLLQIRDYKSDKNLTFIPEDSTKKFCNKDDVMIGRYGPPVFQILKGLEGAYNVALMKAKPSVKVDPDYLYYFLKQDKLFRLIDGLSQRTAGQSGIDMDALKGYPMLLPPLEEQKRIAAILDKAEAIRRKRQQAIQLADDFLRSVFLDMFGDPVTNPKGWEVKKFEEVGKWASGGTPSRTSPQFFEGSINWFSARELNHRYLSGSIEKITDDALNNSAAKIYPKGSMLVGMYDTAAFKISILEEESASNQACANLIPNELIDIEWFFSYIEYSKEIYLRQRRGVRQKNLNLGMIKEFELPLPPKSEQDKFVNLVKTVMALKNKNYNALNFSNDSFSSFSQKAFAGQL